MEIEALKGMSSPPVPSIKTSYTGPKSPHGYVVDYPPRPPDPSTGYKGRGHEQTVFRYKTPEARDRELLRTRGGGRPVTLTETGRLMEEASSVNVPAALERIALKAASYNAQSMTRIFGIDVRGTSGIGPMIDVFRDRNVGLIQSLMTSQIQDVRTLLESAEASSMRVEDLRQHIVDRFGVSKSRADLLARDQVLKLNGQITKERQTRAGVERYVWTTSGDERVREEHAALEGQVFSWLAPPAVGHPGDDYQCRCTAFPLIEELDGAVALDE